MTAEDEEPYKHPILPFKALSYLSKSYMRSDSSLVRLLAPFSEAAIDYLKQRKQFIFYRSPASYNIYELIVVNPEGTPAYIVKNWNGTGANIDVTRYGIHFLYIVKRGIPKEVALNKTMECFKTNDWPQGKNQATSNMLAHEELRSNFACTYPRNHRVGGIENLFPDILVINEINDNPTLPYSMFKGFMENYISHKQDFENFEEIKLTYLCDEALDSGIPDRNFLFSEIQPHLILMLHGKDADVELISRKYTGERDFVFQDEIKVFVNYNNKAYEQTASLRSLGRGNTPDMVIFPRAFIEENLPSYESAVTQTEKD